MQVPAAGHDLFKGWAANEGRVIARATQRLAHGTAKAHHVVGSGEGIGGGEDGFDLTGTHFDF